VIDQLRFHLKTIVVYLSAVLVFMWVMFPILWLLKSSLTPESEMLNVPPTLLPGQLNFKFYIGLFHNVPGIDPGTGFQLNLPRSLLNSLIIAICVMVINVVVAAPAAYSIARFNFRGRTVVLNGMLASRMVPSLVLMLPFYLLFRSVGLLDSLVGVVVAHTSITVPFSVWILRGHFVNVPVEIEKAARVDGCKRFQAFWHVALPLAAPGLVVMALFAFMLSWNEFALALVLTVSTNKLPVQPMLAGLSSYQGISYGFLFAGAILSAIPPALIALILQRRLTQGLVEGAVK
jgi:multiple sugar transport system permease protein